MQPPRLNDDCFALPPGVNWTPVDTALDLLCNRLTSVVATEVLPLAQLSGRVLARSVVAARDNPPTANSAVDGFGFAHASLGTGVQVLPLVDGRSAAGAPFSGVVPKGQAIRILTGAQLPGGVDSVIMQEDVTEQNGQIAFRAGLKHGANARKAGEDVTATSVIFSPGHILQPQDIALMAAVGLAEAEVFNRLRVGVLSTGDELLSAGVPARPDQIFDANRPMLLAILRRWGMQAVDLGHALDDRDHLRDSLNRAAQKVDAIVTSGGASAGQEDHLSAILQAEGEVHSWRIALKPGRPLALGLWRGVPIFGLPGNPVAAFVCTLIFARPALSVMAGGLWAAPQSFQVPAAFIKSKKAGRREYLRARLDADGRAQVYHSEGSGRISGLSWADGLVELGDDARDIGLDDPVKYYPYGSFGL
jgi:molybdopterin molybdotransferase